MKNILNNFKNAQESLRTRFIAPPPRKCKRRAGFEGLKIVITGTTPPPNLPQLFGGGAVVSGLLDRLRMRWGRRKMPPLQFSNLARFRWFHIKRLPRTYGARNDDTRLNFPVIANEVKQSRKEPKFGMTPTLKTKTAFTLAETLITLAIIGVIAALTIPTLLQKHQEQLTITGVSKAYSVLSNALKMAEAQNGPIETWDIAPNITGEGATKLANILIPYLKIEKNCELQKGCFVENYKNLQGTNYYENTDEKPYHKMILQDGMAIATWSAGACLQVENSYYNTNCGSFRVDINGKKGPNRAGVDLFIFSLTKDRLLPSRPFSGSATSNLIDCQHSSNIAGNGLNCTAWVFYKKNLDYLKKDIEWWD